MTNDLQRRRQGRPGRAQLFGDHIWQARLDVAAAGQHKLLEHFGGLLLVPALERDRLVLRDRDQPAAAAAATAARPRLEVVGEAPGDVRIAGVGGEHQLGAGELPQPGQQLAPRRHLLVAHPAELLEVVDDDQRPMLDL